MREHGGFYGHVNALLVHVKDRGDLFMVVLFFQTHDGLLNDLSINIWVIRSQDKPSEYF